MYLGKHKKCIKEGEMILKIMQKKKMVKLGRQLKEEKKREGNCNPAFFFLLRYILRNFVLSVNCNLSAESN